MGKVFPALDQEIIDWISQQKMFFVSTAPISENGLINCSPKGLDTFAIIDSHTVAYLDLIGSGVETIAHLKENGRIVLMFCAFEGAAKIFRLHGKGSVIEPHHPEFDALKSHFPNYPNARAIICIKVTRIADSCGYGVPLYEFKKQRDSLIKWAERKGPSGLKQYLKERNQRSLDGLPALEFGAEG